MTHGPEPTAPGAVPGAKRRALVEEQAHLERVHDRVEDLRRRADARAAEAGADRSGATFQARFERDVLAHHHAARAARLTFGDVESLAFGRLDLAGGDVLHVGRLSVVDEEGEALLVDWRAPAAAPFYRATPAEPLEVARRRTLSARGRQLRDLDDEILDVEAADRLGLEAVTGQGALLASLSRERSPTMRDIVATIQSEQDRIIRSPAAGTLIVTGGPGTGKTVVALHRVAYLLYHDRERFEGRGVLVVGPTRDFTSYTARVLPALGEDRVVQRPLEALAPRGVHVEGWDPPEVARVKGRPELARICHRLLEWALPPIPPTTRVSYAGTTVTVGAERVEQVRGRHLARVGPSEQRSYHARTGTAEQALRSVLHDAWAAAHREAGATHEEDRAGFEAALDTSPQMTMLRRCYWPVIDPARVLARLARGELDLAEIAADLLDTDEIALLVGAWEQAAHWTIDDVALLDELATLLGPPPASRGPAPAEEGLVLESDRFRTEVVHVDVEADEYRDFAHVVVDEAQDLTPMQWRMVARRGPYASWTVVGDLAQRSHGATDASWEDVAAAIGRRRVEVVELEVNYRTPSEVADVARAVLAAGGGDPERLPRAVRATGERPTALLAADPVGAVAGRVAELLAARDGTLAVIAAPEDLARTRREVADAAVQEADRDRVSVLDVRTARGLEFDDVVVVAPERVLAAEGTGVQRLYVAVTRATRTLTLVTAPGAGVPGLEACVQVTAGRR